jgi:hypothetical protein
MEVTTLLLLALTKNISQATSIVNSRHYTATSLCETSPPAFAILYYFKHRNSEHS